MPRNAATNRFIQRNANAAISLDGSTSFLAKASPTGINNGTNGSISFSGWMYLTSNVLGTVVELHVNSGTSPSFGMGQQGGVYYLFSDRVNALNNKTITTAAFSQYIGLGRWVRMTYVLTSTEISVYAGKIALLSASALGTAINAGTISSLFLGKGQTVGQVDIQPLGAYLKDWRAFNGALTQTEVNGLVDYNIIPSSVVSGWGMDEGAGSTVTDAIGTNNLTGTALTWTSDRPFAAKKASVNANMVKNGDFEYAPPFTAATTTDSRWIDGTAAGSTTNDLFLFAFSRTGSNGQANFDTSVTRNSASLASMKVSTTGVNTLARARTLRVVDAPNVLAYGIPLSPNTSYTLSGWMKTAYVSGDATTGAFFRVSERTASSTQLATNDTTYIKVTSDWTRYTTTFTTNASTRYGEIQLLVEGNIGTATLVMDAWFDDISLTPVYPEGRVPANGNLVKNFDFEVVPTLTAAGTTSSRWINGTAAGSTTNATYKWSQIIDATSCNISIDGTVSHSGSGSLKVDCLDATGRGRGCYGSRTGTGSSLLVSELNLYAIRVNPSTSITMTYWIKTSNVQGGGAKIAVHEHDGAGVRNTSNSATAVPGTADWQQITFTVTTAATTQYLVLSAEIPTAGAAQTAWFDDIYLAPTTNPGRVLIT